MRFFALIALAALLFIACEQNGSDDVATNDNGAEVDVDSVGDEETVENLLENPQVFIGEEVTIQAEVARVIDPTGFLVEAPDGIDEQLVAVGLATDGLEVAQTVELTGTFEELNAALMDRRYGVELDPDFYANFEGEYGIVVSQMAR